MRSIWPTAAVAILLLGCSTPVPGTGTFPAEFSPSSVAAAGGLCASQARLVELSGGTIALHSMDALFVDQDAREFRFSLNASDLVNIFGASTVPANTVLEGIFSFDIVGATLPAEGSVVFVGTGAGGVALFVGALRCEP